MPAAPPFPGPSSGAEEGWQVTSKEGDLRHVRLFQGFPGVLEMPGGEKGGKRRGGIPGGGKTQVINLEKCIEVCMVLGVRWEGTRARVGKVWSSRGWSAKHLALSEISFFIRVGVGGSLHSFVSLFIYKET